MSAWRGLHAKFTAVICLAMLVVLGLIAVMWMRQAEMQREMLRLSREATRTLVLERLRDRGEAQAAQAADMLTNPIYYFDLDAIGATARSLLRQPDVTYVLVYDDQGDILHDGSGDIPAFGQRMRDPFAAKAVAAERVLVQTDPKVLDVTAPITLADRRLGGVRIGYSLERLRSEEARIAADNQRLLAGLSTRHMAWIALLLLSLLLLFAVVGFVLQRALVAPIRQLSQSARRIEAGDYDPALPAISSRRDEVGVLVEAFSRMAESIQRHDREMRRMAYTDALTGLANRLAFREALDHRLMQLRGSGQPLALLFADLDDFKRVNDTLGHDVGDDVLIQCANRIREAVATHGGGNGLLARFGGDEFVILVQAEHHPDNDVRAVAALLADVLVSELSRPIVAQERQVFLGASIGITVFPDDASGATMLMKNGDIAMYQAKLAGKHCYRFYSRAMDQAVSRRVRIEHDLRGAWERGELSMAYQPVYRLKDRRLVGAEALLRWRHPVHGQVAPSVFIDVAEQSGLIDAIGPEAMRVACIDAMRWRREFPEQGELFISVNVSARQLRGGEFREHILEALHESRLPAQLLHLELTETAVLGDEERARTVLMGLRESGVKIWLDDFGTGFSGLSHLRRVPVDGVKIDRSFIADLERDPDDLALTAAVIAMAHSLGMIVVAEGVEKEGQAKLLALRDCDLAQGYWLGHPMPVGDFEALLREGGAAPHAGRTD